MRDALRIAVTGMGAVTPLGEGAATLWEGLAGGASGVGPIERFDTSGLRSHRAALVRGFEPRASIPSSALRRLDPASKYAVPAAAQALAQAAAPSTDRTGVVLGTNSAGSIPVAEFLRVMSSEGLGAAPPILFPYTVANAPASQCALILGLRGPNLTIVQKEGSSCGAIGAACRILAAGGAESFLAGGAEDLSLHVFEAFDRIGVLSRDHGARAGGLEGSRPFDRTRNGFVCGEGACFLYLETERAARGRGARPLAFIEGMGQGRSPAPPHRFPEDPAPLARVIQQALSDAAVNASSIDAVFASADSTPDLDAIEAAALRLAFDGRVPPLTSVRGALGESGVGGAASVVAACFALREGRLPGTAGLEALDPALGIDALGSTRSMKMDKVLVTGFGSGGTAAAIVLGAP